MILRRERVSSKFEASFLKGAAQDVSLWAQGGRILYLIRWNACNALLMGDSHPEHTRFKTEVLNSEDTHSSENYRFSKRDERGRLLEELKVW